jgi:hypothetical protein
MRFRKEKAASARRLSLAALTEAYSPRFQFIRSPSVVVDPEAAGAL